MARIDSFLRLVVEQRASDLHLGAGSPPTVRLSGDLVALPFRVLSDLEARRLILEILTESQRHTVETEKDLDIIYELEGVARFRGNVFFHKHGIGAVFRVISKKIPVLADLDLPSSIRNFTRLANGLVLVTGPTGSGKTTTLAAIINEINRSYQRHIVTIEDPIEFIHQPINSLITHREVGSHAETFAGALRAALREAPDVVVVGELRDTESVALALSAGVPVVLPETVVLQREPRGAVIRYDGSVGALTEALRRAASMPDDELSAMRVAALQWAAEVPSWREIGDAFGRALGALVAGNDPTAAGRLSGRTPVDAVAP